jgi:MFS family permease
VLGSMLGGAALLVALVLVELRATEPLIDLRLYGDRLFRSSSGVMILGATAFLGVLFIVALFYQDGLHLTALQSGLSVFPQALGVMIGAQVVSRRLYPIFGPRRIMTVGLIVVAGAMACMSQVGAGTSLWWARAFMLTLGLGMSCVFIPAQAATFTTIQPASMGRASTLFNTARQLGGAIGVATLTTVVAAVGPTHLARGLVVPNLAAYHAAFLAAGGIALAAVLVALTVNDDDAAATIVRRGRLARHDEEVPVGVELA